MLTVAMTGTVAMLAGLLLGVELGRRRFSPPTAILPAHLPDASIVTSPVVVVERSGAIRVVDRESGKMIHFAGVTSATWALGSADGRTQRLVCILEHPPIVSAPKEPVAVSASLEPSTC